MTNYQKRRASGRCGYSGCKETSTKSYCPTHMERIAADLRRRRLALEARGLCNVCGEIEVEGTKGCDDCELIRQVKARGRYRRTCDIAQLSDLHEPDVE